MAHFGKLRLRGSINYTSFEDKSRRINLSQLKLAQFWEAAYNIDVHCEESSVGVDGKTLAFGQGSLKVYTFRGH